MKWHLAQINVATARYEPGDEGMAGFVERLDVVNALTEQSPGFVWPRRARNRIPEVRWLPQPADPNRS